MQLHGQRGDSLAEGLGGVGAGRGDASDGTRDERRDESGGRHTAIVASQKLPRQIGSRASIAPKSACKRGPRVDRASSASAVPERPRPRSGRDISPVALRNLSSAIARLRSAHPRISLRLAPANRVRHRLTDMPRLIPALALSAAVITSLAALEPRAAAQGPGGNGVYHTQFENDWVRLVRVRYPANSKIPLHGHPSTVTAYVYLSESSPVRFTHQGSRTHVVTRQPTTPGGFRVSRGGDESHSAENLGPIASDYLRVEFKTEPAGAGSPFYRDNRPLAAAAKTTTDVRFTNAQMRITRVAIPAGQTAEIATTRHRPGAAGCAGRRHADGRRRGPGVEGGPGALGGGVAEGTAGERRQEPDRAAAHRRADRARQLAVARHRPLPSLQV